MIQGLLRRMRSDRGDSELVSLIILLPIVVGLLFTMVDTSIYFSNRAQVQAVARDGARTVAIMGGNGTGTQRTAIERQYGQDKSVACAGLDSNSVVTDAFTAASTATECNMMQTLATSVGLVNVEVHSVACSPTQSSSIGERVSCSIQWTYGSIPASGLLLIRGTTPEGNPDWSKPGLVGNNLTVGTSEAEVNLTGVQLVPR